MNKLYIGVKDSVLCIDKQSGKTIWKEKLKSSTLTNIVVDEHVLFAHAGGHLFCLDKKTGKIHWENELRGMGYGPCIIATDNQAGAIISNQQQNAQQAAALTAVSVAAASNSMNS